jgi:hypothetical protein
MRNGRLRVVTEARVTVGRRGLFYSVRCLRWARSPARSVSLLFSSPSLAFCWWRGGSLFLVARGRGWLAGVQEPLSPLVTHLSRPPPLVRGVGVRLTPTERAQSSAGWAGSGKARPFVAWPASLWPGRLGSLPAAGARVHVALPFQWRLLGWMLAGGYLEVTLFDPSLVPWWVAAAANEGAVGSGIRRRGVARGREIGLVPGFVCSLLMRPPIWDSLRHCWLLAAGCSGWTGAGARAAGARRPRD